MGWADSPPYFCAATETVADLANDPLDWNPKPHRLDSDADTPPVPDEPAALPDSRTLAPFLAMTPEPLSRRQRCLCVRRTPLAQFDVFVMISLDRFKAPDGRERLHRVLFHSLDEASGRSTPQILPTVRSPLPSRSPLRGDAC
jgi:hypothetical protein